MKHFRYMLVGLAMVVLLLAATPVSAQTMGGPNMMSDDGDTPASLSADADVQKGQAIYTQLQNKQTTCEKLTSNDFDVLGGFYMNRMMGSAHDAVDQYMTQNLGANGERRAHIAMGERLSGCNVNASYPDGASNYPSMAWMGMMNGYSGAAWSDTSTILAVLLVLAIAVAIFAWFRPRHAIAHSNKKDTTRDDK